MLGIVLANLLHGVPIDAGQQLVGGLGDLLSPYALGTGVVLALLGGAPPTSGDPSRARGVADPARRTRSAAGGNRGPSPDPGSSRGEVGPAFQLLAWAAAILLRQRQRRRQTRS